MIPSVFELPLIPSISDLLVIPSITDLLVIPSISELLVILRGPPTRAPALTNRDEKHGDLVYSAVWEVLEKHEGEWKGKVEFRKEEGFRGRTLEVWVLNRGGLNFCVRSSHCAALVCELRAWSLSGTRMRLKCGGNVGTARGQRKIILFRIIGRCDYSCPLYSPSAIRSGAPLVL